MAYVPYDERIHGDLERARAILPKKLQTKNAKQVLPGRAEKVPGKADTGALFGLSGITDKVAGSMQQHKATMDSTRANIDSMRSAANNNRIGVKDVGAGTRAVVDAAKQVPGLAYKAVDAVYTPAKDALSYGISDFMEGYRGGEPYAPPVDSEPKIPGQVNPTGQDSAIPAEATAAKLNEAESGAMGGVSFGGKGATEPRSIVTPAGEVKTVPGLEPGLLPRPSDDIGPIESISGAQKQTVNPTGIPHGGAPGLDTEGPLYTEFIGENTPEGRAKAEAASMRRNVFHRPYDSDAVRISRQEGADLAARDYLRSHMEGATDKAKLAAERELGLATLGVRKQEIAGRENVAKINAKGGVTDYKKTLEQAMEFDRNQYYNRLRQMQEDQNEETRTRNLEAMREARPEWYKEMMGQEY